MLDEIFFTRFKLCDFCCVEPFATSTALLRLVPIFVNIQNDNSIKI